MARRTFKDYKKGVTPVGTLVFPKIITSDKRYESEWGEFNCLLDLEGQDAEDLKKLIDDQLDFEYEHECSEKGKELNRYHGSVYGPATDRDKEVIPGVTRFRFKRKAGGRTGPKSKKPGTVWTTKIPVFGASGNDPVTEEVWGGSTAKIAFQIQPWWTASLGFGCKLSLEAVQIISLVTSNGARTANAFGFDEVDGGYVPEKNVASQPTPSDNEFEKEDTPTDQGVEF